MRSEAVDDPGPWRRQAILGQGQWDADALRDFVREYALETLGDQEAVVVIDETGPLKKGKASCGSHASTPARQARSPIARSGCSPPMWRGMAMAFIDLALYLQRNGRTSPLRLKAAHVPRDVRFATKPQDRTLNDLSRDRRKGAVSFVAAVNVYGTGDRNSAAQGRQRLCSGYCFQSCVPVLGQAGAPAPPPPSRKNLPKKAW
ncbi:transposase [Bradyrhizobium sp. IC3069]|uniref:transposase n=1 Tax=unclassified Bradyrhizobium TaxID=2631580 RepID=UPI001CD37533|nr:MULTISPECIES: transposase [unclassified Bradyrhizobium]MCA1360789.1 transposase [Bradyrhizobium sp. IC4059]MCA1518413.1 transposase [Bradyrhizobium sp. IC3069]